MSWERTAAEYRWRATEGGSLECAVDLASLDAGMTRWSGPGGVPLPLSQAFALRGKLKSGPLTWEPSQWQHHVRGADLIVELPYSEQTPTGIEFYWRAAEIAGGGFRLEWLVSANTRLLDEVIDWSVDFKCQVNQLRLGTSDGHGRVAHWHPVSAGVQQIETPPLSWEAPATGQPALWATLPDAAGALAWATAPGDQCGLSVTLAATDSTTLDASLSYHLQMGFLEKGVIRRARLWLLWLPERPGLAEAVAEQLRQFYLSPPPLTV